MLINFDQVQARLDIHDISVKGVFHIGAHNCEELIFYKVLGVSERNCLWIDALEEKVNEATKKAIPNVYQAVISDKDNDTVIFNVSNNIQSSSILKFGSHEDNYKNVYYTHTLELQTTTIDSFFLKHNIDPSTYTLWNLDIQGAELMALRGAIESLKHPKAIYLEINTEEVYKGCGLLDEIDTFLKKFNFIRMETKMTENGWGDALYILME